MAKLTAGVYGKALFDLAREKQIIGEICGEAEYVAAVWRRYPDFARLISHPQLSSEDKMQMVENVFEGLLSEDMIGFITLVIKKDHSSELLAILGHVIELIRKYKKEGTAYVTSAAELTSHQRVQIEKSLIEAAEYGSIRMYYAVDASLIGGLVIRMGGRVIDGSLRAQIERLEEKMAGQ